MLSLFHNAVFDTSVAKPSQLPPPMGVEIAFAGRSNAGKSSAINVLTDITRLAFVSKTPGRTQLINFFRLSTRGAYLVDLPGYGYAKVPLEIRRQWQGLLEHYLTRRENLCGLVLLMDTRHPLTPLDTQMLDWFAPRGKPIHILLTKSDKFSRSQSAQVLKQVRADLIPWGAHVSVQLFSSLKKTGVDEAIQAISPWIPSATPPTTL